MKKTMAKCLLCVSCLRTTLYILHFIARNFSRTDLPGGKSVAHPLRYLLCLLHSLRRAPAVFRSELRLRTEEEDELPGTESPAENRGRAKHG